MEILINASSVNLQISSNQKPGNFAFNQWGNREISDIQNQKIKQILHKIHKCPEAFGIMDIQPKNSISGFFSENVSI